MGRLLINYPLMSSLAHLLKKTAMSAKVETVLCSDVVIPVLHSSGSLSKKFASLRRLIHPIKRYRCFFGNPVDCSRKQNFSL